MRERSDLYVSPIGPIRLKLSRLGLSALDFIDEDEDATGDDASAQGDAALLNACKKQLDEYFAGTRRQFDLPLDVSGPPFTLGVWRALGGIGYGETRTYRDIAKKIANPNAVRAVGNANGKNPVPIIIPCHRVIGSDGGLGGYSCGLARKAWLLAHEAQHAHSPLVGARVAPSGRSEFGRSLPLSRPLAAR